MEILGGIYCPSNIVLGFRASLKAKRKRLWLLSWSQPMFIHIVLKLAQPVRLGDLPTSVFWEIQGLELL